MRMCRTSHPHACFKVNDLKEWPWKRCVCAVTSNLPLLLSLTTAYRYIVSEFGDRGVEAGVQMGLSDDFYARSDTTNRLRQNLKGLSTK